MYTYRELCDKKVFLFKTGKIQQDIEDFFYELNVAGYVDKSETGEHNGKTIIKVSEYQTSQESIIIICDFEQPLNTETMNMLNLNYMKDYIFAIDLVKLIDDHLSFEFGDRFEGKKRVIWGAGQLAEKYILRNPHIDVAYVVDNDESQWGKMFFGHQVKKPEVLIEEKKDSICIVICYNRIAEIVQYGEQADDMGFELNRDYFILHDFVWSEQLIKTMLDTPKSIMCDRGNARTLHVNAAGSIHFCCANWLNINQGNIIFKSMDCLENSVSTRLFALSLINKTYSFCNNNCSLIYRYNHKNNSSENEPTERIIRSTKINFAQDYLLHLDYDYTCNLKCLSCRSASRAKIKPHDIKIMNIIQKGVSEFAEKVQRMKASGYGDPVFSKYYSDVIFNHFNGKELYFLTNGQLFNETYWDKLCRRFNMPEMNITVEVSVDAATADTYKTVRGGNFDVLLNNLRMISGLRKEGKITYFAINFTIQYANFRDIPGFVKLGQELGADITMFTKIENWIYTEEEFKKMNIFDPNHNSYKDFMEIIESPGFKQRGVYPVFLREKPWE